MVTSILAESIGVIGHPRSRPGKASTRNLRPGKAVGLGGGPSSRLGRRQRPFSSVTWGEIQTKQTYILARQRRPGCRGPFARVAPSHRPQPHRFDVNLLVAAEGLGRCEHAAATSRESRRRRWRQRGAAATNKSSEQAAATRRAATRSGAALRSGDEQKRKSDGDEQAAAIPSHLQYA